MPWHTLSLESQLVLSNSLLHIHCTFKIPIIRSSNVIYYIIYFSDKPDGSGFEQVLTGDTLNGALYHLQEHVTPGNKKKVKCYHLILFDSHSEYMWQDFMKRKFKQWWSTIPSTSTKQTITSHLNLLNTKKRPQHMMLEIHVLAWDRSKNVAELNLFDCLFLNFLTLYSVWQAFVVLLEYKNFEKNYLRKVKRASLTWTRIIINVKIDQGNYRIIINVKIDEGNYKIIINVKIDEGNYRIIINVKIDEDEGNYRIIINVKIDEGNYRIIINVKIDEGNYRIFINVKMDDGNYRIIINVKMDEGNYKLL
jgi:hypothetical protein